MAVMDGHDYDEFQVFIDLPHEKYQWDSQLLKKVIDAGCRALGIPVDDTKEINWVDSYQN